MIVPPALHGMCCKASPLFSDDYWVDDDGEEVYRKTWEKFVKDKDYMSSLEIQEKYVEIDPPMPEVINVKPGDTVCVSFNFNEVDIDFAYQWMKMFEKVIPETVNTIMKSDTMKITKEES